MYLVTVDRLLELLPHEVGPQVAVVRRVYEEERERPDQVEQLKRRTHVGADHDS